jgi:hypothetical protein
MTHKEALEQISDKDIREKAIAYTPQYILESDYISDNLGHAICQSFSFDYTLEGREYWLEVYEQLRSTQAAHT